MKINLIKIKSSTELKKMKTAGKLLATVFAEVSSYVREGKSTKQIDTFIHNLICKMNAKPAFLNYHGFPATTCISINAEVVHGIPKSTRLLKSGMIVGIDVGLVYDGFYSDCCHTYMIGKVSPKAKKLVKTTEEALLAGIAEMKAGKRLGDIGYAICRHAKKNGFTVVRDFVGHGIGKSLHEQPQVPNFGKKGTGDMLLDGMVLAIEPMLNEGRSNVTLKSDNWTVVTVDRKLSAHFEHTVALIDGKAEILTQTG